MQQSRSCDLDLDWNFLQKLYTTGKEARENCSKNAAVKANLHFPSFQHFQTIRKVKLLSKN